MELARDITAITSLVLIASGCWWIYPPAALIVIGAIVLGGIVYGSKRRAERIENDDT